MRYGCFSEVLIYDWNPLYIICFNYCNLFTEEGKRDMDNMVVIVEGLLAAALILVWGSIAAFILVGCILAKIYEVKFFSAAKLVLKNSKFDLDKCVDSIRNSYDVYRRHRFGFNNKGIIAICQELAVNLRNGKGLDSVGYMVKDVWADKLDKIIKQLQYEEAFDDEKANEIVKELDGNINNSIIENVRRKLAYLEEYHKGIISVKNMEIQELKYKESKDKWIKYITSAIGVIGSIASIISLVS